MTHISTYKQSATNHHHHHHLTRLDIHARVFLHDIVVTARSVKSLSRKAHPVHDKLNSVINSIKLLHRRYIKSIGIINNQRACIVCVRVKA